MNPFACARFCAYHQARRVATGRGAIAEKAASRATLEAIRRESSHLCKALILRVSGTYDLAGKTVGVRVPPFAPKNFLSE